MPGRRNEHTQGRKVRCALDCMDNLKKKMQRLTETISPTRKSE